MKGLFLKDLLILKKYIKTIILVFGVYVILGVSMDGSEAFGAMFILFFVMQIFTGFAYDEQAHWEPYALTMPVSKKSIVLSKYMLAIFSVVLGGLSAFVFNGLVALLKNAAVTKESIMILLVGSAVGLIYVAILIPLIFKFGTEKTRISMMAVFLLPFAFVLVMNKLNIKPQITPEMITFLEKGLPFIVTIALVIVLLCSYCISVSIMKKKEV